MSEGQVLLDAVLAGDCGKVKEMLDSGINPSMADPNNQKTLLMYACMYTPKDQKLEIVTMLLDHGADFVAKDDDGDTALTHASLMATPDVVELILDRGADVSSQNNNGRTALMLASEHFGEASIEVLIKHGAKPHLKDNDGKTAWDIANEKEGVITTKMRDLIYPGE